MSSTCKKCLLGASILHVHVKALLHATSAVSMVTPTSCTFKVVLVNLKRKLN